MSGYNDRPRLGATFQPGGKDDYYMPAPAVVSPAPQRHLHELPGQIQDGIQRLELDANSAPSQRKSQQDGSLLSAGRVSAVKSQSSPNLYASPSNTFNDKRDTHMEQNGNHASQPSGFVLNFSSATNDEPDFSSFPKLDPRPPYVPESDEEHLQRLENLRAQVLNSTDAEQQLIWAQDTLKLVDILAEQEERVAPVQSAHAQTFSAERQVCIDAINIVMFLASQQHPRADFIKGMWLEFGKFGQVENKVEAFRCYKRAAAKGFARAEYRMGMQFESTNEPVKALQHYQQGEALEDSASCYRMGMMSLLGQLGQPQDFNKAIRLIRKAAESADENAPQGAYVYGMLQAKELPQIKVPEIFLPFDLDGARCNVEKAAYLGFPKAQLKMGSAYELCLLGCEFNPCLSLHYNALAAARGEAEAEMAISKWFLCGYEGMFHKNEELAFRFARRAAESDFPMAEFALGYYNEIGVYVSANVNKALEWYQKAANNGNKDARDRIAAISSSQTLSKTDHEQVAISRIQSLHGSRRGGRPERFQRSQPQQLPDIPDEDSRVSQVYSDRRNQQEHRRHTGTAVQPQYRTPSVTPYPADDLPVTSTPYPVDDRPVSSIPYPVDNRPVSSKPYMADNNARQSPRPSPIGGFFAAGPRPSTTASDGRYIPQHRDSQPRPPPANPAMPVRQYGPMNRISDGRSFSTPPAQRLPNVPNAPQGQRPVEGQIPGRSPPMPSAGVSNPPVPTKQPLTQTNEPNPRTDLRYRRNEIPSQASSAQQANQTNAPSSTSQWSNGRPKPESNSRPTIQTKLNASANESSSSQLANLSPNTPRPGPSSLSSAKPAQNSTPGKGPQTFEEMGVPMAKQDNDCILM